MLAGRADGSAKARTAIENWIDDPIRSQFVMAGDMAEIQRDPQLAVILHESTKYGPEMLRKLQAHLIFMIDNRRKYHAAQNASLGHADPA